MLRTETAPPVPVQARTQLNFPLSGVQPTSHEVAQIFSKIHDEIRNGDGLQPDDALDEFVKVIFVLMHHFSDGTTFHLRNTGIGLETEDETVERFQEAYSKALSERASQDPSIPNEPIALSDRTLLKVLDAIDDLDLRELDIDLKSTALRVFLSGASRRGLGIFLTPDNVVRMIVDAVNAQADAKVLDPCCGSGSFLLHTILKWKQDQSNQSVQEVWACERNERILRLAEINLAPSLGANFHRLRTDSLISLKDRSKELPAWFTSDQFDIVLTNPPFGVYVDAETINSTEFSTPDSQRGKKSRFPSEFLFIERCIQFLRPGGALAIVVPNSVLTVQRLKPARREIDRIAQLTAAVSLPPETFYTAGTQSTTSVLFFIKRGGVSVLHADTGQVVHARVSNVGVDATGRPREGSELIQVSNELDGYFSNRATEPSLCRMVDVDVGTEFSDFCESLTRPVPTTTKNGTAGLKLAELATVIATGRTPPRREYLDAGGHFIVKVGNLTGGGIDWFARDRNYVSDEYIAKIQRSKIRASLIIENNDILLTSTAHSSKYIGKKVDIVDRVPAFVTQPCTFVGEIMLIRPNPDKIDPLYLLSFLRTRESQIMMQNMVRGQTAHLYPGDVMGIEVPDPNSIDRRQLDQLLSLLEDQLKGSADEQARRRQIEKLSEDVFGGM